MPVVTPRDNYIIAYKSPASVWVQDFCIFPRYFYHLAELTLSGGKTDDMIIASKGLMTERRIS